MQAAFRAQNPYKEFRNGELVLKKSAYLFDFAPTRVLEIYDQFANGLNPKAVQGEITEKDREENIKELLNFFPVISEDVNGEMIELDANKVLTFPNALAATEIVNARFMTNLLFNDSLKGVFSFPKEVEEILNKMPEEKNKRVHSSKSTLDLDDARDVNNNKTKEINTNTEIILGEKIFKTNTERVVDTLLEQNKEQIHADDLVKKVSEVAEPLIAKYKEVYKATQAETNEVTNQIKERVKQIAEEFNNADVKDSEALKQKLIDTIELDFVTNKVTQKEDEKVEKVQKTKEDEIRDRLRSFTRTIPMFIMANDSKDEITIDNFDLEIVEQDFLELTSITKEEFHKLRDGFDYEEDDERKTFQGVFNKYRFNASIAEFRLKKVQLANYFTAEEDIFELIPNQKTNQIFTPKKVVQMMINNLEEHDSSLFTRTDSTFIDLYMKSGMYITEIVKKLYNNTRSQYKSENECLKHILENQVYGLAPTPILQGITQSYIFGFDVANKISRKNFIQHDITPEAQEAQAKEKLQELFNLNENMKFDAVVGNPPYQIGDGSGISTDAAVPIYNKFIEESIKMSPKYLSLIIPSKWMVGGRGLQRFREQMMEDKRIKMMYDYENASDCFPGVHIDGGVCCFIWDKDYNGKIDYKFKSNNGIINNSKTYLKNEFFEYVIRDNRILSILNKVSTGKKFSEIVSETKPFGIRKYLFNEPERFPESNLQLLPFDKCVKIYGVKGVKGGAKRIIGYINRVTIVKNQASIDKYKLFFTTSYSTNAINPPETILGLPNEVCTETFLMIGHFDTEYDQLNCYNYRWVL